MRREHNEIQQIIKEQKLSCVNWGRISENQTLSEDFIREFQDRVEWDVISKYQTLSEDVIREFQDKVDWNLISIHQTLSENFIREFEDRVHWYWISRFQTLSEDFIREFRDRVSWYCISEYQTLSEDFIREFQDKVSWVLISIKQTLSEDFIREFKDIVHWYCISEYQTLSEGFIREFRDRVSWDMLEENKEVQESRIDVTALHEEWLQKNCIVKPGMFLVHASSVENQSREVIFVISVNVLEDQISRATYFPNGAIDMFQDAPPGRGLKYYVSSLKNGDLHVIKYVDIFSLGGKKCSSVPRTPQIVQAIKHII